MTYTVALVGARGYVGREMMALIERDPDFTLAMATSREYAGRKVSDVFEGLSSDVLFEEAGPDEVAARGCDVVVLGLPNGLAAPFVEAINRVAPDTLVLDLSADHRHKPGWTFGISDVAPETIKGATRIANPGCYATAGILPLHPIADLIDGVPSVFGISGYSGAGTTPGPKNDPKRLADNILPYGFAGHGHQAEISTAIGHPVRFMPHVAQFFRGLICTVSVPLKAGATIEQVMGRIRAAYAGNPTIRITAEVPEPQAVANTPMAWIGGAALDGVTGVLAISCAHDNLLKGAASQALANLRLAKGLERGGV